MKRTSCVVALNVVLMLGLTGAGQVVAQSPAGNLSPTTNAANAWMKTPTIQSALGQVAASIRATRDQFWDNSGIAPRLPLTQENAGSSAVSAGAFNSNAPEIPQVPNRAILIGTFMSFQSILTASRRALYTDVIFQVHEVVHNRSGHAVSDARITVSIPGGTVTTSSGHVISYLTQPLDLFLQPGKAYILVLSYQASGDFYTLADDWIFQVLLCDRILFPAS